MVVSIGNVLVQHAPQAGRREHDHVIEAVPTENLIGRNFHIRDGSAVAESHRVTAMDRPASTWRLHVQRHDPNAITSGQCLANSFPNTGYQQDPTRATGTRTRESRHLRYAVNRRVAGSNPA